MKKVFLYLYPVKEYTQMFLFHDEKLYEEWNVKKPLPILNECIQKRYRDKGYEVVIAIYPDKEIYGIYIKPEDKVIQTDILFTESSAYDEKGNVKPNFTPKYPNEKLLISKLGNIDKLVVGGYHAQDCVKRVAESALEFGIDTLIDLDLTDFFFNVYRKEEYFKVDEYDHNRYKDFVYSEAEKFEEQYIDKFFKREYSSPVYGFNFENKKDLSL